MFIATEGSSNDPLVTGAPWPLSTWLAGYTGEDGTVGGGASSSINQDPTFVNPTYPYDNYQFADTGSGSVYSEIQFDPSARFPATYTAGRTNALVFPQATAPGFTVQLLGPFQF